MQAQAAEFRRRRYGATCSVFRTRRSSKSEGGLRLAPQNSAAFSRQAFETACFDSFILIKYTYAKQNPSDVVVDESRQLLEIFHTRTKVG